MRWLAFCLAVLFALPAYASVTWVNQQVGNPGLGGIISHRDTAGNVIDAHEGTVVVDTSNNHVYRVGNSYQCNFQYRIVGTPWCGVRVYDVTDFHNPVDLGYLFDPAPYQTYCSPNDASGSGCFRPSIRLNPTTGKWVLWMDVFHGVTAVSSGAIVITCDHITPANSNCVQQATPTLDHVSQPSGFQIDDIVIFADPVTPANAYVAYSYVDGSGCAVGGCPISVKALNSAWTDTTGTVTDTGVKGEGLGAFIFGGKTYITSVSQTCAYCSTGTPLQYTSASTPLGSYAAQTQINANSCNGQAFDVMDLRAIGGDLTLEISQWYNGNYNQGLSTFRFEPLSFTAGAIDAVTCHDSVTITGVTGSTWLSGVTLMPRGTVDQTTVADDIYNDRCDIGTIGTSTNRWWMQTFTPTATTLAGIWIPLGRNWSNAQSPGTSTQPDGTFEATIQDLNQSTLDPTGAIANGTVTLPANSFRYATQGIVLQTPGVTYTAGHKYGLRMRATGNTAGCFSSVMAQGGNTYSGGVVRHSDDGTTWSTDATYMFLFQTHSALSAGGGRLR